jgi:high-affinity nickel permease
MKRDELSLALASQPVSLGLLTVLTLGFFLGMRHAADADHVVTYNLRTHTCPCESDSRRRH